MGKEISRMLTLSTAHISKETAELLSEEKVNGIITYNKFNHGWFIYVPDDLIEYFDGGDEIPLDLWSCMLEANTNYCNWLCLDRDGEVYTDAPMLKVYEW